MSEFKGNQKIVVEHEKGNILVSASAGSGKTFTMISRAIRLIKEKKTTVSEILALTFTEAAAYEMKEKLKNALKEVANGDKEFISQINDVATSDISTIHAFCARLIRVYFYACDQTPDFKILDESEAESIKTEALNNLFSRLYESGESGFLYLLKRHKCGRSDQNLRDIVLELYEKARVEPNPKEVLSKCLDSYTKQGYDNAIKEIKELLNDKLNALLTVLTEPYDVFTSANKPKGTEFCAKLYEAIKGAIDSDYNGLGYYAGLTFYASFDRNLSEIEKEAKEKAKEIRDKFLKTLKKFIIEEQDECFITELKVHAEYLTKLCEAFFVEYEKAKKEENVLDFSDLEHFALKVLDDPCVREEVSSKYKYVFVDEYQDTNTVQEYIISRISNDNLFMVGDDKQSIYGFRGCRPEIFLQKEKSVVDGGGKSVTLNNNFRSATAILNAVNRIFTYCMTKDFYGYSYAKKSMLVSGEVYPKDAEGRVELHLLLGEEKTEREQIEPEVYDVKKEYLKLINSLKETQDVNVEALHIAEIIEKEYQKTYYDVKQKKFRSVTPNDVVILTRNIDTAYVSRLVSSLIKLGIPINSKVSVNALDYPEVKTLVAFLELLENKKLDLPLVTVMKSPIGDFTDDELATIAFDFAEKIKDKKASFTDAYFYALENAETNLKQKLRTFDDYINSCRFLSDFIGAKGVLDKVVNDSGYLNSVLTQKEGKQICQTVEFFLSKASTGDKLLTVREFLFKIKGLKKSFKLEPTTSDSAVKIMTIHASKGLEFPVVIVCGLEKKSNSRDEHKEVLFSREYGFLLKGYDQNKMLTSETPYRLLLKERMRVNRIKEELRLLYVALTRASYSLHLVYKGKKDNRENYFSGADKYIDYIPADFPATIRELDEFTGELRIRESRKVLVGKVDQKDKERIKNNLSFVYPYLKDVEIPLKTGVTSALKKTGKYETERDNFPEKQDKIVSVGFIEDDQVPSVNLTGAERGTIAHKILELYDFNGKNLKEQVLQMIASGKITEEQANSIKVEKLENAIINNVLVAVKNKTLYREAPFFAQIPANILYDTTSCEKVLVQGVIDLLAVDDSGAVIVDYKYSSLSGEKLKETYKKQLDIYAYAVENVLGIKVSRKIIFNVLLGETVELD